MERDSKGRFTREGMIGNSYGFRKGDHKGKEFQKGVKMNLGRKFSKEWKNNLSIAHQGYRQTSEHKEKNSKSLKEFYNRNPEMIKKILGKRDKSSLEIKFENIINQLGLPYKFVGNGEVIVARKCPDFVNINGEKIAIDIYYKRHKNLFRGGLEQWKAERIKIFNENGWQLILLDETQVNENNVKEVLTLQ